MRSVLCWLALLGAVALTRAQTQTEREDADEELLQSMHCFNQNEEVFMLNTNWKPASFFTSTGVEVKHTPVEGVDPSSVLSSVCEATNGQLEFLFTVPPSCAIRVKMYFANAGSGGPIQVKANGNELGNPYDVSTATVSGTTLVFDTTSNTTGIMTIDLLPESDDVQAQINGMQIFATQDCPFSATSTKDTTAEADEDQDESELVYRMACSQMMTESGTMDADMNKASTKFLDAQQDLYDKVSAVNASTELFKQMCLPAADSDMLNIQLALEKDQTYEVYMYFVQSANVAWSDVVITADGKDVFPTNRNLYAAGRGAKPSYLMKKFELRSEKDQVQLAVASLSGFPPMSGLEVYKPTHKAGAIGKTLLDRPDDFLSINCGSKVFKQIDGGEIVHPGVDVFTANALKMHHFDGEVSAADPSHQDYVSAGLFNEQCIALPGEPITGTLKVVPGEQYTLNFYWVELAPEVTAAGQRVMNISVDGVDLHKAVDVFSVAKKQGTTMALTIDVTAKDQLMEVDINPVKGQAMLSLLTVKGAKIDAAAADKTSEEQGSQLKLAASCGGGDDAWKPLDPYMAAGFEKFTGVAAVAGASPGMQSLYKTHCFAAPNSTLTMQLTVVPESRLRIVLHFAEVYFDQPGQRVFDVLVNGIPQLQDVDLVKLAGPKAPVTKEIMYIPTKRTLSIQFVSKVDNAMVNAIEVYAERPPPEVSGVVAVQTGDGGTPIATPGTAQGAPAPAEPAGAAAAPAPAAAAPVSIPKGVTMCVPQAALDAEKTPITVSPSAIDFGEVHPKNWMANLASVRLTNPGKATQVTGIKCTASAPGAVGNNWFRLQLSTQESVQCSNTSGEVVPLPKPLSLSGNGANVDLVAFFEPTQTVEAGSTMAFLNGDTMLGELVMSGSGGNPFEKEHTLHPVVESSGVFAMPRDTGGSTVYIDGRPSHTHDGDRKLVNYIFSDVRTEHVVTKTAEATCFLPFGTYTFELLIQDDALEGLTTTQTFVVAPEDQVPGTLLQIYQDLPALDPLPDLPVYATTIPGAFQAKANDVPVSILGAFVLRLQGTVPFPAGEANLKFTGLPPSTQVLIKLDGESLSTTKVNMTAGEHNLDIRVKLAKPVATSVQLGNGPFSSSLVDISQHPPIINELTTDSITKAGLAGLIKGFLLREPGQLFLAGQPITNVTQTTNSIAFKYPAGLAPGDYNLVVKRGDLVSNKMPVTIQDPALAATGNQGGPFADAPEFGQKTMPLAGVSRVIFCHGKMYASQAYHPSGIYEYEFDSNYEIVAERKVIDTPEPFPVTAQSKWSVLGLACDPRDTDADFKLYFAHSNIFRFKGQEPKEFMPYIGTIYYVQPNKPDPKPVMVVENIAVANSDHSLNGLDFLNDGRLVFAVGSQTNAGIPGALGYMPESPTSADIMVADVRAPGFNGSLGYKWMTAAPAAVTDAEDPMDQRFGDWVEQTNPFISVYAAGTRNPYGIRVGQTGNVIVTINGPNMKFGQTMTGMGDDLEPIVAPDPQTADGFYYDLKEGCHAGSPNIARCRVGIKRDCTYTGMDQIVDNPPQMCKPTAMMTSSLGGPCEYKSYAFGGAWNGRVMVPSYKKHMVRFNPDDGKFLTDTEDALYPSSPGIDCSQGPGGVHLVASLEAGNILINYPVDATVTSNGNPSVYDIVPNKGLKQQPGPTSFILGGANFDAIQAEIKVTFGGVAATNVTLSPPNWIKGYIPSNPTGTCETDVSVHFGTSVLTLPGAFCYLAK